MEKEINLFSNMKEVIWKDIKDFKNYQISAEGEVRRLRREKWVRCKIAVIWRGYLQVALQRDKKKQVVRRVHRLVAEAFIPNPNNLPSVLHLDDNPSNNNVDNLRWGTHKDNMNDRDSKNRQARLKGENNGRAKLTEETVLAIRAAHISKWGDIGRLARQYNVNQSRVNSIRNRKSWKHI
jgi:hypothetical protein